MNAKVESQNPMLDRIKWMLVGILLIVGFAANHYFIAQPVALKIAGWIILVCAALAVMFQTEKGKKLWEFAQESRMELRKVVWPTREETIKTTLLIIAMVCVAALMFWAVDSFLLMIVGVLTGQRGW